MKKLLVALIVSVIALPVSAEDTALLPEVQQIIDSTVPMSEYDLNNNAYAALMAMDAPETVKDYKQIGKEIVSHNDQQIIQAVKQRQLMHTISAKSTRDYYKTPLVFNNTINDKPYILACNDLTNQHCVTDTIQDAAIVNVLLKRNKLLLERYQDIIKMPVYKMNYMQDATPVPTYPLNLSSLRLAQALLMIDQGQVEKGLAIIEEEITFAKRILNSDQIGLIDVMVTVRQLSRSYHVINGLLNSDKLATPESIATLQRLLQPLTAKEQQAIARGLETETKIILLGFYTHSDASYKPNTTTNLYYQKILPFKEKTAKLILPQAADYYQQSIINPTETKKLTPIEILTIYGEDNYTGGFLESRLPAEHNNDLYRFYDLVSYLDLVNTQLKIKQAGIDKTQVANYLKEQNARNLYSHQPYSWDEQQQTLTTSKLAEYMGEDGKQQQFTITISLPTAK